MTGILESNEQTLSLLTRCAIVMSSVIRYVVKEGRKIQPRRKKWVDFYVFLRFHVVVTVRPVVDTLIHKAVSIKVLYRRIQEQKQ